MNDKSSVTDQKLLKGPIINSDSAISRMKDLSKGVLFFAHVLQSAFWNNVGPATWWQLWPYALHIQPWFYDDDHSFHKNLKKTRGPRYLQLQDKTKHANHSIHQYVQQNAFDIQMPKFHTKFDIVSVFNIKLAIQIIKQLE